MSLIVSSLCLEISIAFSGKLYCIRSTSEDIGTIYSVVKGHYFDKLYRGCKIAQVVSLSMIQCRFPSVRMYI